MSVESVVCCCYECGSSHMSPSPRLRRPQVAEDPAAAKHGLTRLLELFIAHMAAQKAQAQAAVGGGRFSWLRVPSLGQCLSACLLLLASILQAVRV